MHRPGLRASALAAVLLLGACSSQSQSGPSTSASSPPPAASRAPIGSPSSSPSSPGEPTAAPTASSGTNHTVRGGDTLASIARAYATTTAQLQAWNAARYPSLVRDPNVIEPGWTIMVSEDPGATPRQPTPAPTTVPPSQAVCTAGSRVAPASAQTYRTIPDAGAAVALTFDMGGRMDPAVEIMRFLVDNEVCATIFATGVMSQTPQGEEVLAIIRAHPELFEIANHTMYHCDLVRGGGGSPTTAPCTGSFDANRVRRELTDAEAILRSGTGQDPQPYWRPPYGSISQAVVDAAASAGYRTTFLWDIDTVDWKPISDGGPTAEQIATKVVGNAVNGSNVLFHLGGYETLESLRLLVPGLRDRGFTLTSLSDLLD